MSNDKNNGAKNDELRKLVEIPSFEEELKNALKGTNLDGQPSGFDDPERDAALEARTAFDGSNTTFTVGEVLCFDPAVVKIAQSHIGTRGATVMFVPSGTVANGAFHYKRIKQVYLSSFTKTIRVADDNGNPVLGPNGDQVVRDGRGNAVWEAMIALPNELARKNFLRAKYMRVSSLVKDFGPAGYVQIGNSNVPKAHRLTTLPLFEDITSTVTTGTVA